jgi:hypothetical protein
VSESVGAQKPEQFLIAEVSAVDPGERAGRLAAEEVARPAPRPRSAGRSSTTTVGERPAWSRGEPAPHLDATPSRSLQPAAGSGACEGTTAGCAVRA